jgi:D-alanyl-D-alanine carboxypeptidase
MRLFRKARAIARTAKILTLSSLLLGAPATALANSLYAGIVVDAKTGKTLYSSSADSYRYPASLTKIMTLYIVFEELEAGRLSLDSELTVSSYASQRPPSKLGLKPGGTIKVKDAILALVTKSANDVASTVAENLGGSERKFAERMTRTARQIGMSKTTFRNPHGLPDNGQRTTARDMATLGIAIQERFPQYYGYFKTRSYSYKGRTYGNHNRLLGQVKGVDGIKTGYIRASGFNLVTSVNRDGRQIVAVVMGGRTGASRNAQMTKLIGEYLPKASRGAKTAPLVAQRVAEPDFVAVAMKNPPLPNAKPSTEPAPATGSPMVLAFTSDPASIPAPAPAPAAALAQEVEAEAPHSVPGFGTEVPIPPKSVKQRFDATFAVATALPPIPPESPDAPLSTNSISKSQLLEVARAETAPKAPLPVKTVKVETISVSPLTVETVKAPEVAALESNDDSSDDSVTVATSDTRDIEPGWQVQIAATETETQAIAMLRSAKEKTGSALKGRVPYTEPVDTDGQTLYRARFVGFDTKTAAWNACKSLKKAKYACFAIYQ